MSYFVNVNNLRRWLDKAQTSLASKNKVRKDLWTDFSDILLFEDEDNVVPISSSEFTTLQSFLQTEGRSDSISNDMFLSWVTTLHELRKKLNRERRILDVQSVQEQQEEESEEKSPPASPQEKEKKTPVKQTTRRKSTGQEE